MAAFEILVNVDLHIIELDLNAVKESVLVCSTGGYLVKRVYHLDDTVEDSLGKNEAKVTRRCLKCGVDERLVDSARGRALTLDKVTEALYYNSSAKHIAKTGDRFTVSVRILEGLGEMLCDKKRKVGIFGLLCRVLVAVSVYGDDAVCILVNDSASGIHTERSDLVAVLFGAVNYLAFVKLVRNMCENLRGKLNAHTDIDSV